MSEEIITKKAIQELLAEQTNVILTAVDEKLENKANKETTDKILASQDAIVTKLDKLLQEKTFGDAQDKRKTEVLRIHNNALKKNKILSETEILEINNLGAF